MAAFASATPWILIVGGVFLFVVLLFYFWRRSHWTRRPRAWFDRSPDADLKPRVRLLDALPDVRPYYAAADVCLHPTRNDSFGMAPLEAMAYGVPVVLSPMPWCGFAQYVQHGVNALVLDRPDNAEALAGFVAQLQGNVELRARLSAAGRALAEQHSWAHVAARYQEVYAQILRARANT